MADTSLPVFSPLAAFVARIERVISDSNKPKKQARVKLVCNECGRKFSVSPNAADPSCPKCGGVDWDVVDEAVTRG